MNTKLKWAAIQPLTGGMYLGTEQAIGHPAEWILSFPGINSVKYDKDGNIDTCGNEYNLTAYLEKHNRMVPYYVFEKPMFESELNLDVTITKDGKEEIPNYNDLDLVIAVPVCSGLSMVTAGSSDTKCLRNSNMLFITKYALNKIKPKMYIFENAPTLMGPRGNEVRPQLEEIAKDAGYSVLYYKTDTQFHDNAQKRPRTFIIFMKWDANHEQLPFEYGFEDIQTNIIEYFNRIPKDASQQIPLKMTNFNKLLIEFAKNKYGENWRSLSHPAMMENFTNDNTYSDFIDLVNKSDIDEAEKDKIIKFVEHAKYKLSIGKNYYAMASYLPKDNKVGSIQFKSMGSFVHPIEERHYTIRECLALMGMPNDFELQGDVYKNYMKIGQNVPVRTAYWIASEAKRILENWNTLPKRIECSNVLFIDNITKKTQTFATE